jgi:hypothetical protein
MGMEHRIGLVKEGYDAGSCKIHEFGTSILQQLCQSDVVLWDTHPLALSATPIQVFIDGIPQLTNTTSVTRRLSEKPFTFQEAPKVPNFDKEAEETLKWEGLPPLLPKEWEIGSDNQNDSQGDALESGRRYRGDVLFVGVGKVYVKEEIDGNVQVTLAFISEMAKAKEGRDPAQSDAAPKSQEQGVAFTRNGKLLCYGLPASCSPYTKLEKPTYEVVDLQGGALSPGLISFGAPLGLQEIDSEPSTSDGEVLDPLVESVSDLMKGSVVRAVDGLQFTTRDAL